MTGAHLRWPRCAKSTGGFPAERYPCTPAPWPSFRSISGLSCRRTGIAPRPQTCAPTREDGTAQTSVDPVQLRRSGRMRGRVSVSNDRALAHLRRPGGHPGRRRQSQRIKRLPHDSEPCLSCPLGAGPRQPPRALSTGGTAGRRRAKQDRHLWPPGDRTGGHQSCCASVAQAHASACL